MNNKISLLALSGFIVLAGNASTASETAAAEFAKTEKAYSMNGQATKKSSSATSWQRECVEWCKRQKLAELDGAQCFVDSSGGEHKLGIGVVESKGRHVAQKRIAENQARLIARKYLMLATSANVQRAQTNKVASVSSNNVSGVSSSKITSYKGTLSSSQVLVSTEVKDGDKKFYVVVMSE